MLDEGYIHTALPSNLSKSSNLSSKAQDYDIISLQLTQSSKHQEKSKSTSFFDFFIWTNQFWIIWTDLKKEHLLHEAVIKNDINKVNSLLEANVSVNSRIHVCFYLRLSLIFSVFWS